MHPSLLILLSLLACNNKVGVLPNDDTGGTQDTGADGGTGGDAGGTTTPTPGDLSWTSGPDLPDCTAVTGSGDSVALSGVVLLPDGPVAGMVVYSPSTGEITCAGDACDAGDATVVCTEGVISAGLIDAHNHLQYNVIPPWQHDNLFEDRYEWRSSGDYWDYRTAYDDIENDYNCEIMRWAELRVLVGGGTSAVGSSGGSCIDGLVRNLDEDQSANYLDNYDLWYSSSTVTDTYDPGDGSYYQDQISSGATSAILNHVAEGVDGAGTDEITWMQSVDMVGPGMAYVHATDATTQQLAEMAADGTSIVWSPRSNLDLYAQTTPADIALRLGVDVALGPDWTWSGSMNPAHEASCAVDYLGARGNPLTDVKLHGMVTDDAARIVGLDGILGTLDPGMKADISVFNWSNQPYRAVIQSGPTDVRLVIVNGDALYGVADLLAAARGGDSDCETVTACTESRTLCAVSGSGEAGMTQAQLSDALSAALAGTTMPSGLEYAGQLHGLWDCDDSYASCDPREGQTTDTDTDGDGIEDSDDVCVGWFDPRQDDLDGDGVGDACDPCPLAAGMSECSHDPDDIDGDGLANDGDDCPWIYDDQSDSDGDGHGDACDDCPDVSNPGDTPCPALSATVDMVRNPDGASYVGEGATVTIDGLVVTGVSSSGYYAQDPTLSAWGGVFVYTGGAPTVSAGDQVNVTGTVTEYYGLTELSDPSTDVTGTASIPALIALSSACDVAEGTDQGEQLESMLVTMPDATVTDSNPDSPDDYGEFEIDACLRVDDALYSYGTQPAEDTVYSTVAGVLSYTYSHRKVEPRDASDLVGGR
ncbi:MAG: amidohydrolase family protein [Oligoflexia bacterium]|nr:amidohydrolase family protein [Oligoflexia bacterium]